MKKKKCNLIVQRSTNGMVNWCSSHNMMTERFAAYNGVESVDIVSGVVNDSKSR